MFGGSESQPEAIVDMAFELGHACVVTGSGSLRCAGENHLGELGASRGRTFRAGVELPGAFTAVRVGRRLTCGLGRDGGVVCWGALDGIVADRAQPWRPPFAPMAALSVASGVVCGADLTGRVECHGTVLESVGAARNDVVGLGLEAMPHAVFWTRDRTAYAGHGRVGIADVVRVDVGSLHACALTGAGRVGCWGDNGRGQLGVREDPPDRDTVVDAGLSCMTGVAVGDDHSCALRSDGTVWCWGDNALGQLGDGTERPRSRAEAVRGITGAVRVFAGPGVSCAALGDGSLWCWGAALWLPGELPPRLEQPTRVSW